MGLGDEVPSPRPFFYLIDTPRIRKARPVAAAASPILVKTTLLRRIATLRLRLIRARLSARRDVSTSAPAVVRKAVRLSAELQVMASSFAKEFERDREWAVVAIVRRRGRLRALRCPL